MAPNKILVNVVYVLNGKVNNLFSEIEIFTTCKKAVGRVQFMPKNHDFPVTMSRIKTPQQKQRLKALALSLNDRKQLSAGPLSIVNAVPSNKLPSPKRSTPQQRKMLKENFSKDDLLKKPFAVTNAGVENQRLPTISCRLRLPAIDANDLDPVV